MKSQNKIFKIFMAAVLLTVLSFTIAIYSGSKAISADPQILNKIVEQFANKYHVKINQHGGFYTSLNLDDQTKIDIENVIKSFPPPKKKITVKLINSDLKIVKTDDEKVSVDYLGASENKVKIQEAIKMESNEDNLTIAEFENPYEASKMTLKIPANYKNEIEISTENGFVSFENIHFSKVDYKSVAGSLSIKDSFIKTLDAKNVTGELNISDSEIIEIFGKTVSGQIEITNKILSNMTISTISGEVNLKLAESANYQFNLKSLSGDIKNSKNNNTSGDYKINVSTTTGSIKIN